jgi:methylphosphotriester-DNA--protein-cysteine methyltransferase
VGSKTSKKYHRPDCRYALKIKPENRIYFAGIEEAQKQGYIPCKTCSP